MRRYISLLMIGLLSFMMTASVSCDRTESPVKVESEKVAEDVLLEYIGSETLKDVVASIEKTEELSGYTFTDEEKAEMLQDFRDFPLFFLTAEKVC